MPRTGKRGKYKLRELTDRQRKMFQFIHEYIAQRQYPPSIREICDAIGVPSSSVVNYNLGKLVEHGLISRERHASRAIKLNYSKAEEKGFDIEETDRQNHQMIPVLGNIVASNPVDVGETRTWLTADEHVHVSQEMIGYRANVYALRVQGDSMIDSGILDNDIVVMSPPQEGSVRNGDLVAAWIADDNAMTLKQFYREGDFVRLQPSSPNHMHQPVRRHASQVEIQGKVLAVLRSLD